MGDWARSVLKNRYLSRGEHHWYETAGPYLKDRREPPISEVVEAGRRFCPLNFEGEAIITMGRAVEFVRQGAAMVVNCAPFGCMPGTLTTAMLQRVQAETGVPMVGMFYDGEEGANERLNVFLASLRQRTGERGAAHDRGLRSRSAPPPR